MKSIRLTGLAASAMLYLLTSQSALPTQPAPTPFDESYRLSQSLEGDGERIYYLIELCHKSPVIHAPADRVRQWSTALFDFASTNPNQLWRTVGEKNAVTSLSYVDPQGAMELLHRVSFQRPPAGKWVNEDSRFNAAEKTFMNFLGQGKTPDFPKVIEEAKYLGATGQYPYWAMSEVVHHSPAPTHEQVNTIFSDALSAYRSDTGFYNRDEEFLYLLDGIKGSGVDKGLAASLVEAFVEHILNDPVQFPGNYYAEIHVSNGKVFPFIDRNAAFLFKAFPLIRQNNPALAAKLIQQDPQLKQATANMNYISGGFILGDPTTEQATQKHFELLQSSLINRIKELQPCHPAAAAQIAQRLSTPSLRIVGFSAAAQGMAKSHPDDAHALYQDQVSELADLDAIPSTGRLGALVALASAAHSLGESQQYQDFTAKAFDMGVDLFNNDVKSSRVQGHSGFAQLQELVTFAAAHPTEALSAKLNGIQNNWLKAYLLLYEAEGQAKLTATAAPQTCPE